MKFKQSLKLRKYFREYARKWRKANPKRFQATQRRSNNKLKTVVLTYYGKRGMLQCCWPACNVIDIDMLTLDHINDEGYKDKRKHGRGITFYKKIKVKRFPVGFQTLCANHQLKKEILRRRKLNVL